jgi:chemotaxis protein MotB
MRTVKVLVISAVCACTLLASGCNSELQDLRIQNDTQQKRIDELQAELAADKLLLAQLKNQLATIQATGGVEAESLQEKIAALEEALAKKNELIASLQQVVLGGTTLPVELSTMLEDFARRNDMVTYDATRGIVKFKSDLLFDKGSDTVAASAVEALKSLSVILNSEEAKEFDVIIAGHTDDMRIARATTKAKHPTNWHLSVHRAIAVKDVLEASNVEPKRMSVRGFGEYRPVAENLPGKKGNPQNRRVEIYIVAKGV